MKLFTLNFLLVFVLSFACFAKDKKNEFNSLEMEVDENFLYLPINNDASYRDVKITTDDGNVIFNEAVMLCAGKAKWYAPVDVSKYKGKKIKVEYQGKNFIGEPIILLSSNVFSRDYSADVGRPKFHITATNGVLGSSSGLFYYKGNYYAFILQNPKLLTPDGSFHLALWKSSDMVNWYVVESTSFFQSLITAPASVCVDNNNHSGFFDESGKGVIFACTNNQNQTFIAFADNLTNIKYFNNASAVIEGEGKWPFIFFNEDSKLWTIVRTETSTDGKSKVAIYVSEDLKKWTYASDAFFDIGDTNVNLVKIDVLGAGNEQKWVMLTGNGRYIVGNFDGKKFVQLSKKPINFFNGSISYVQTWANMPNNQILASATIEQPLSIMMHVKQDFVNSLSTPWKLNLVRISDGQFQLRASIADQIMEHVGVNTDASGGGMIFNSNTFTIPDAYANYCVYDGTFEVDKTSAITIEIGVGVFGYSIQNNEFFMRRLTNECGRWQVPVQRSLMIIPYKAIVDSYSAEVAWMAGDSVLMMGDSFLNPQQTFKVGAVGVTRILKLDIMPVFKNKVKDLREATRLMYINSYKSSNHTDSKQK